jgi:hypothetical protein
LHPERRIVVSSPGADFAAESQKPSAAEPQPNPGHHGFHRCHGYRKSDPCDPWSGFFHVKQELWRL